MDAGAAYQLPVRPRHLAVDERGVGLRATWHAQHGLVNLSLWSDSRCVQTFHLTPVEAGRLVGFLATVLAEAASEPAGRSSMVAGADRRREGTTAVGNRLSERLADARRDLADALDRAARRLRR